MHSDYNAEAWTQDGNTYGRGVNGGPGNRAETWPGDTAAGINGGYLNGMPRLGGARQAPGAPTLPGSSGHARTERTRSRTFYDLVYENWVPFTAWLTSRFIGPRPAAAPWLSPIDVDAGEHITRWGPFPSGMRPFPYPYMTGAVSGFMPMLDQLSMQFAYGKTPSGPGVLTPVPIPWDIQYPQLPKQSG